MHKKLGAAVLAACVTLAFASPALAAPRTCKVGAYVISLYDFDFAKGTFGADLWLWSTCPSADLKPLDVMDFVNATQVTRSLPATSERAGVFWSYVAFRLPSAAPSAAGYHTSTKRSSMRNVV